MRRATYFGVGLYLGELVIGTMMALYMGVHGDSIWPYIVSGLCFITFTVVSTYMALRAGFEDRWYASEAEPPHSLDT